MKRVNGSYRQLDYESNSIKGVGASSRNEFYKDISYHKNCVKTRKDKPFSLLLILKNLFQKFNF